jgi:hypothetical protein
LPKPKRSTQRLKRRAPSLMPMVIVPTLLDWARMRSVVKMPPGSFALLWIVRSATWIVSPSSNCLAARRRW